MTERNQHAPARCPNTVSMGFATSAGERRGFWPLVKPSPVMSASQYEVLCWRALSPEQLLP
jgi:hypothetical protein